jgi:hypothetical protein
MPAAPSETLSLFDEDRSVRSKRDCGNQLPESAGINHAGALIPKMPARTKLVRFHHTDLVLVA